ncbi:MAG: DNA methylase [Actinobacteria bacterium]|nr:DNA methylase [Actinomycetota bacterium]
MPEWRNRIVGSGEEDPAQLLANPLNWRGHPVAQREALRGVLREVGVVQEVIINRRSGFLLDGHLRVDLALEDGQNTIPVKYVDIDQAEEALILATLDPLAALATANTEKLEALLGHVASGEEAVQEMLAALAQANGLVFGELPGAVAEDPGADLDHADELRETWGTEVGQLWKIPSRSMPGREHRLLCGDSTSVADVGRLMAGERAALFATDPPYAVAYDGTNHPHKWGKKDNSKDWSESYREWDKVGDPEALYDGYMRAAREAALLPDAAWYCWYAHVKSAMVQEAWEKNGAFIHQVIVWVKDRPILTRSWYMWQHEPCLFGWVRPHKPKRVADDHPRSVWEIPTVRPGAKNDHLTSKPVELFAIPMAQHTVPGDLCYEPFAGSGSQHVAGEQTGRLVYGLEIEPRYVAVILERMRGMGLEPRLVEA